VTLQSESLVLEYVARRQWCNKASLPPLYIYYNRADCFAYLIIFNLFVDTHFKKYSIKQLDETIFDQ
jgi:hypothetical protein